MKSVFLTLAVVAASSIAQAQTVNNTYFLAAKGVVNRSTEVLRVATSTNDTTKTASLDIVANTGFLTVLNSNATIQYTPSKRGQNIQIRGTFTLETYFTIKTMLLTCKSLAEAARNNKANIAIAVDNPKSVYSVENRVSILVDANSKLTCQ